MNPIFDHAFALVIGVEGGYVNDPLDRGNWTTGIIGQGECKGTKYGISAMSYPGLDIASLTLDQAKAIYLRDYWLKIQADQLPPAAAIVLFDYAVNSGCGGRVKLVQTVVGVPADGEIGSGTLAAIARMGGAKLAAEITAQRMLTLAALPTWKEYGRGWARRMAAILAAAVAADTTTPAVTTYISPMPPIEMLKQAMREVQNEKVAA